jgi:hypothetical protein
MGIKKLIFPLVITATLLGCATRTTHYAHSLYNLNNCYFLGVNKGDTLLMRIMEENYEGPNDVVKDTTWVVYKSIKPLKIISYKSEYLFVKTPDRFALFDINECSLRFYSISAKNETFDAFCDRYSVVASARPKW